ncbi:MAG: ABC transporter substrate-binding protein [Vicinamibacterales bacterium]
MSAPSLSRVLWSSVVALLLSLPAAAQSPARIVSLAPSVTEVLFEAGAGPRVVGVTSYCRFPRAVLSLPKIGGYLTPNYEALVALQPDLVVTLAEHADLEPRIRTLGIPILRVDHRSLEGIVRSVEQVGERCGVATRAKQAAEALRQTLAAASRLIPTPRPRVLICFGRADDVRRLTAAAPGTIHDDLITHAGGVNALTSGTVSYPTLSAEGVVRLDPDVIIEFSAGHADAAALRRQWRRLDSVRAVRNGRVHVFTDEFLSVPGPRFVRFADTIARAIRGE